MAEEIIIKGAVILDQAGKITDRESIFEVLYNLSKSEVLIAVNDNNTFIMMLPKCNCENCRAVKEVMIKYSHGEIEKSEVNDLIEKLGVSGHQ